MKARVRVYGRHKGILVCALRGEGKWAGRWRPYWQGKERSGYIMSNVSSSNAAYRDIIAWIDNDRQGKMR